MPRFARKSRSHGDQRRRRSAFRPSVRNSKSQSCVTPSMYSVSELLMESAVSTQTRTSMREAVKNETFGYRYGEMVRSERLTHLTDDHVDKLVLNIKASQKLLAGVLRSSLQPKISNGGFVRSMNNTTRLVLDRLVSRKSPNSFSDVVQSTLNDTAISQWQKITICNRTRRAAQVPPRIPRRELWRLPASDSTLSLIRKRRTNTLSTAELYALAQTNSTTRRSDSNISLPRVAVPEDASITIVELEGDAQYWNNESDVIGLDIYDPSTYDHEEVVDEEVVGEEVVGEEVVGEEVVGEEVDEVSSDDSSPRLYIHEGESSSSYFSDQKSSAGEQVAASQCVDRKRKLLTTSDEKIKYARTSVSSVEDTRPSTNGLKRQLDSSVDDREVKRVKREQTEQKSSATAERSSTLEADGLIWTEIVNNILHVYASSNCTTEHFSCLSKRMGGDGTVDPITGLMFNIPLPFNQPDLWDRIVSFFSPQKPWCKEADCVTRKHTLSLRDAHTENIIRSIIQGQRRAPEYSSSEWSVDSQLFIN